MLLFDLSKESIIFDNKLLYWFHFLQTQILESTIIMIGTKTDKLEKKISSSKFRKDYQKLNEKLSEINQGKLVFKFFNLLYF